MPVRNSQNEVDLVIFDFDGTLANSAPWLETVFNDVAAEFGFSTLTHERADVLRTLSTRDVLRELGLPRWKVPLVARRMRQLAIRDADQIFLFEDAADTLHTLAREEIMLAIATSNAGPVVRTVLGPALVPLFFEIRAGASLFGKSKAIGAISKRSGLARDRILYVGDEERDVIAARKAGVCAASVAWGYASSDRLACARPDFLWSRFGQIVEYCQT
ncbi:HAD hydrolase-like protein [Parvularcula sp. LCG005]|uniref:HAD hydrolase-like protein n=1 Tax=Parvularcula sp. LCG005 TaxID=3078805 RepID=UPI0029437227|nr:HAD hydrolase-like protein [Parvularcula sp. LCG005]WOI52671.1 HAD hydrolase-like protein [Parvularcula sp. LCG005]